MKPILVVDNSTVPPRTSPSANEPPEIRLAAAWRAMQDVLHDHVKGVIGDEETLDIIYGYLNDPRLNADVNAVEP